MEGNKMEETNRISFEINEKTYEGIRTDPYGFWHVNTPGKIKSTRLKGNFTTFDELRNFVRAYEAEFAKNNELKKESKGS